MDLTTAARVESLLIPNSSVEGGFSAGDTTLVGTLITAVSAAAERYLDRHAQSGVSRTEHHNVYQHQKRWRVKGYPIATLAEFRFDTLQVFGADTELASSLYYDPTLDESGVVQLEDELTRDDVVYRRSLRIVYTGGMAANTSAFQTAFPDIDHAIAAQVAHLFQRRHSLGAVVSGDGGSVSVQPEVVWLSWVRAVLDQHRRLDP